MSHLDGDDRVHLVLADRLAEGAQTAANAADKTGFYSEALDEYSAAIKLSPSNVDALNNYAYTVWEWYLSSIQGGIERPDRNVLEQAERYASRASQLTKDRVPRATHAMTQSTLGEVQLARGETGAAINTLQAIFNAQGSTPYAGSHAIFDEIRWDLTEAYVCAKPRVPGSKDELPPKARELWNKIAEHEADREHQRFPQQLKIADLQHACAQFGKAPATEMASARDPD